ncbi:hypothetical protein [Campylobacter molothri]|uniref:hypothetical protein n=1 Tax=Campylobacter molothri TaxID=1032242 RepID=UPI001EFA4F14|nr:hypothetical protein [Campylobacter sp. RM10537]ULO00165.1 hypothetical protein CMOL_1013 [Campylobacter sp. RM10537]
MADFFLHIDDKELRDFYQKLKNSNINVVEGSSSYGKGDISNPFYLKDLTHRKASKKKIEELAKRYGI